MNPQEKLLVFVSCPIPQEGEYNDYVVVPRSLDPEKAWREWFDGYHLVKSPVDHDDLNFIDWLKRYKGGRDMDDTLDPEIEMFGDPLD